MYDNCEDRELVTESQLAEIGLSAADVREHCPWAVEYTALDGEPAWLRSAISNLLEGADR